MIRPTSPNSLPSKGKPLTNKIQKIDTVVKNVPEGYVTGEEFWMGVKADLKKLYQENGLLQQTGSK